MSTSEPNDRAQRDARAYVSKPPSRRCMIDGYDRSAYNACICEPGWYDAGDASGRSGELPLGFMNKTMNPQLSAGDGLAES